MVLVIQFFFIMFPNPVISRPCISFVPLDAGREGDMISVENFRLLIPIVFRFSFSQGRRGKKEEVCSRHLGILFTNLTW